VADLDDPPGRAEHGADPTEEAPVDRCDAKHADCDTVAGEREAQAQDCEFTVQDELGDAFKAEPIPLIIDPNDGIIRPVDPTGGPGFAQPFCEDTLVCMEDERTFVELFEEELLERGWTKGVVKPGIFFWRPVVRSWAAPGMPVGLRTTPEGNEQGACIGVRSRYDEKGAERERESFEPAVVSPAWGQLFAMQERGGTSYVIPVRAKRERCKHYRRQVFSNDDQPDPSTPGHYLTFRNCVARRSIGGAFLSIRDEAVYACDHRDPYEAASVASYLDEREAEKLRTRPDRTLVPLFGLPGEAVQTDTAQEKK
jgi:hypothetical protein